VTFPAYTDATQEIIENFSPIEERQDVPMIKEIQKV